MFFCKELRKQNEFLEREVTYWRQRADEERNRADRATDDLLQMHGAAPVTEQGVRRVESAADREDAMFTKRMTELTEIFGEVMEESGEETEIAGAAGDSAPAPDGEGVVSADEVVAGVRTAMEGLRSSSSKKGN